MIFGKALPWRAAIIAVGLLATLISRTERAEAATLSQIPWDALANIKTGGPPGTSPVGFDPGATALNGKRVELDGYMTPFNLGTGTTVTSFLMTGTPGTCPFCLGAGPENFVIVTAVEPVTIDITGEMKLTGQFQVLNNDETGFYYKLNDARAVK